MVEDDAGMASDTFRASRVGSSSTSIVLTGVRGIAFLSKYVQPLFWRPLRGLLSRFCRKTRFRTSV